MVLSKAVKQKLRVLVWVLTGLLLFALLGFAGQEPWVLVADPQWLGPMEHVYVLHSLVWWIGGGGLVMAAIGVMLGRSSLWVWVLGLLVMGAIFGIWWWLLSLEPPVFNG
ncbi:MAG TPA: hypothetical protein ENJ82_06560 [Bacteroidetes bacterium]|nr:hypothetical protein [Bacteroidota bacterium]